MSKFISFVSDYVYDKRDVKIYRRAEIQLNDWLTENPDVQILNWSTQRVGKNGDLCIIVEYQRRDLDAKS